MYFSTFHNTVVKIGKNILADVKVIKMMDNNFKSSLFDGNNAWADECYDQIDIHTNGRSCLGCYP